MSVSLFEHVVFSITLFCKDLLFFVIVYYTFLCPGAAALDGEYVSTQVLATFEGCFLMCLRIWRDTNRFALLLNSVGFGTCEVLRTMLKLYHVHDWHSLIN